MKIYNSTNAFSILNWRRIKNQDCYKVKTIFNKTEKHGLHSLTECFMKMSIEIIWTECKINEINFYQAMTGKYWNVSRTAALCILYTCG